MRTCSSSSLAAATARGRFSSSRRIACTNFSAQLESCGAFLPALPPALPALPARACACAARSAGCDKTERCITSLMNASTSAGGSGGSAAAAGASADVRFAGLAGLASLSAAAAEAAMGFAAGLSGIVGSSGESSRSSPAASPVSGVETGGRKSAGSAEASTSGRLADSPGENDDSSSPAAFKLSPAVSGVDGRQSSPASVVTGVEGRQSPAGSTGVDGAGPASGVAVARRRLASSRSRLKLATAAVAATAANALPLIPRVSFRPPTTQGVKIARPWTLPAIREL
ncbi:hypothetical protein T492DRAFT_460737 [Pavlovales sp. CCMP2436]|nr:hypothetical protein T492DRAFT_460737 [Pavlovales sp. CCMP2436]